MIPVYQRIPEITDNSESYNLLHRVHNVDSNKQVFKRLAKLLLRLEGEQSCQLLRLIAIQTLYWSYFAQKINDLMIIWIDWELSSHWFCQDIADVYVMYKLDHAL